jgi:signal transduction histidine kinase
MDTQGLSRTETTGPSGYVGGQTRPGTRVSRLLTSIITACILCVRLVVFGQAQLSPTPAYRTAASILALSPEEAQHGQGALLRGVVTGSTDLGLTIQDSTGGIWVYWDHPESFTQGDLVEVSGEAASGRFSSCVEAHAIRNLGHGPLPHPKAVTFRQLSTGDLDAQYVSVTGVVRSMGIRAAASQSQNVWLKIALPDGNVDATFSSENAAAAGKLIDAVVRVNAPAMCTKNENRQITAPTLPVGSLANLTVLRAPPQDLFAVPLTPISRLMQYRSETDYYHRVRVAGTVTYYKPGDRLILEQSGRALRVMSPQVSDIRIGDQVEALGFPAAEDSGPFLEDAVLRYVAYGQPLQPMAVKFADISSGAQRYNLVITQGFLLRRVDEPTSVVLLLQSDSTLLVAELDRRSNSRVLAQLEEGSTIQVTGISMLEIEGTWNYGVPSASAVRYKLLLRSPEDVHILKPPSWWTTLHVIYIAAVLAALMFTFLVLGIFNRVERWKLQAVLEERERMAHEIHDTLAQSFAGIGFQMQAIRRAIPDGIPHLQQQVDLARDLVRHSHREARRSVEPLRLDVPEDIDLLPALKASALKMVEGCAVEIAVFTEGPQRTIPPMIAGPLLRIGQEAIANAVRHADPKHLKISLVYGRNSVQLAIADDGSGFVKSGDLLGFGLRGMRTRAAGISAKLEILSQPGEGTRVEVTAPLPPDLSLVSFFKRTWKHLLERTPNVKTGQQPDTNSDCG